MRLAIPCAVGVAIAALAFAVDSEPVGRLDVGAIAPAFALTGADGRTHALADAAGKVAVLEWTNPVCPYTEAKYRSGAIQALQRKARAEGALWFSIDTAAPGRPGHLTPSAAKARLARLDATVTAFLFDETGKVGRLYGAKATPSFFLIDRDGRLAYEGAMDDETPASRPRNYVAEALDDLAASRPVRTPEARPYGCAVEY